MLRRNRSSSVMLRDNLPSPDSERQPYFSKEGLGQLSVFGDAEVQPAVLNMFWERPPHFRDVLKKSYVSRDALTTFLL
jgi:hypothetical protein